MAAKTKSRESRSTLPKWKDITWDDLEAWSDPGSLERGEGYFHGGNVESLALAPSGELLAWVQGNERYAVQIALAPAGESPRLASLCTCPVGYACKHAVAAVLTYLQALNEGRSVPVARPNDPRLRAFDDDDDSSAPWDEESDEEATTMPANPAAVRSMLAAKSRGELIELALHLTGLLRSVRGQLDEAALLISSSESETRPASRRPRSSRRPDEPHRGPRLARHP